MTPRDKDSPAFLIFRTCLLTLLPAVSAVRAYADDSGEIVRHAVSAVAPSVVRIRMIGSSGAADLAVSSRVTTGVVISENGLVLTSVFGFTGQAAAIFVEDSSGNRVAAKVVATDHVRKLVLLQCEDGAFVTPVSSESHWPDVGASSIAVGRMYPGTEPSVSVGIISAVNRIYGLAVQTDAKISPVNYGGPLIDLDGRVLGILVPLSPNDSGDDIEAGVEWYDSGIGFAIPMVDALKSAEVLKRGQDRVRGVLGIRLSTRNPLASSFEVTAVHPDSPAAREGLKAGDQIIDANGVTIDRFGIFEAIVKRSYAGEGIRLMVKRGDELLNRELIFADQLVRPVRGYLGMIVGDVMQGTDDKVLGVQIRVLPESPLAKAGLPETAVLSAWQGKSLTSLEDLARLSRLAVPGQTVDLTWFVSTDDQAAKTVVVEPVKRPEAVVALPDDIIATVTRSSDSAEWKREEKDFGEDAGKVWFYTPQDVSDIELGIVVLLSDGSTPHEVVLNRWAAVCQLHNLILVVPVNAEKTELTREHRALIQKATVTAATDRKLDTDRVVLVTSTEQAEVCTELILQLRRRQFRAAAFVDAWPQISGIPAELLAAASPSSLMLTGNIQSRQRRALQQQAVAELKTSGAWVVEQSVSDEDGASVADRVANWALNLKVR